MPDLTEDAVLTLSSEQADQMIEAYVKSVTEPILALDCQRRANALPPAEPHPEDFPPDGPPPEPPAGGLMSPEQRALFEEQRGHEDNRIAAHTQMEAIKKAVVGASPHGGKRTRGWRYNVAEGTITLLRVEGE